MIKWIDEWTKGQINEWMNEQTNDERMNETINLCNCKCIIY